MYQAFDKMRSVTDRENAALVKHDGAVAVAGDGYQLFPSWRRHSAGVLAMARKGVTVNAVCPGFTDTDIVRDAVATIVAKTGRSEQQARTELVAGNPQQRLVHTAEVANAVLWLCMPQSGAMNGQSLAVAGGGIDYEK